MAFNYDVDPGFYGPEPQMSPPVPPMASGRADAAKRSARMRLLAALAGGLSAPNQGGGFFGGLAAGFSGSVGAGMGYERQKHEEQRQAERDEAERKRQEFRDALYQRDVESRISDRSAPPGTGSPTGEQALLRLSPDEFNELVLRKGKLAEATRTPARPRGTAPAPKPKGQPKPPKVKPGQAYSLVGREKLEAEHVSLMEQMKTDTRADAIGTIANNAALPGPVRAAAMKRLQELGGK